MCYSKFHRTTVQFVHCSTLKCTAIHILKAKQPYFGFERIIVINNTLFKTDATKIPLPPPLLLAIGADALSLLPTFLVGCCVMEGNGCCCCHCHCHHHTLSSPMEEWRRRCRRRAVPCGHAIMICHHYLLPANASGWLLCNRGDGCVARFLVHVVCCRRRCRCLSSLPYFIVVVRGCQSLTKGMGGAAMVLSSTLLLSFLSVGVCCCVMEGWALLSSLLLLSPLLPATGEEVLLFPSLPPSPPCRRFWLVVV